MSQLLYSLPLSRRSQIIIDVTVLGLMCFIVVWGGLSEVGKSSYWSEINIFGEFLNTSIRLLLPLAVAVSAGYRIAGELRHNFISHTRTRVELPRYLSSLFLSAALRSFLIFGCVAVVAGICAFVIVPQTLHDPELIVPADYGISTAELPAAEQRSHPLAGLYHIHWVWLVMAAAVWLGVNSAVLALVTVAAVILVEKTALAFLVPVGIYLVESIIVSFLDIPAWGFLFSTVYPGGLNSFPLLAAVIPNLLLLIAAVAGAVKIVHSCKDNPRFG